MTDFIVDPSANKMDFVVKAIEPGYFTGEICGRNGCIGMIQEDAGDGGCSCHINPPCHHCVTDHHFCLECGWTGEEEQIIKEQERRRRKS